MAITPSVHVLVSGSNLPYNWSDVIALGFNLMATTFKKSFYPFKKLMDLCKHSRTLLFPENACPTIINP